MLGDSKEGSAKASFKEVTASGQEQVTWCLDEHFPPPQMSAGSPCLGGRSSRTFRWQQLAFACG